MSLFQKARAALASAIAPAAETLSSDDMAMAEIFGGGATDAGVTVSENGALTLPAAYASVRILSTAVAALELVVEERVDGFFQPRPDHRVQRFLDNPNPTQPGFNFLENIGWRLHSSGNGVAILDRSAGYDPARAEILQDRAQVLRVIKGRDGRAIYDVMRDDGIGGRRRQQLDQDFVIHFAGPGGDGLWSPSPIMSYARDTLGLSLAVQKFQARMMNAGAKPSGVLAIPDGVGEETAKRLRSEWDRKFTGLDNSARTALLWGGAEFKPVSFTSQEAEILATRRFQIADIARIWGVPLHMLAETEKSTAWGSGLAEQSIAFVRFVIRPILRRMQAELNRKLFRTEEAGRFRVRFDVDDLMRGTPGEHAKWLESVVQRAAILTPNEGRATIGKPPMKGGDELRDPTGAPKQSETEKESENAIETA